MYRRNKTKALLNKSTEKQKRYINKCTEKKQKNRAKAIKMNKLFSI